MEMTVKYSIADPDCFGKMCSDIIKPYTQYLMSVVKDTNYIYWDLELLSQTLIAIFVLEKNNKELVIIRKISLFPYMEEFINELKDLLSDMACLVVIDVINIEKAKQKIMNKIKYLCFESEPFMQMGNDELHLMVDPIANELFEDFFS